MFRLNLSNADRPSDIVHRSPPFWLAETETVGAFFGWPKWLAAGDRRRCNKGVQARRCSGKSRTCMFDHQVIRFFLEDANLNHQTARVPLS